MGFDIAKIKKNLEFLKDSKVQKYLCISLLILIIFVGGWIRLSNIKLLKDVTTGEYLPADLDATYFLRIAKLKLKGSLPAYDSMRYKPLEAEFTKETLPAIIVYMYKFTRLFNKNISIEYIDIISPVVFFAIGIILFFFLIYILTKSKTTAILSCIFLAISNIFLMRTMAGFSDHDALGVAMFFLAMLVFSISLISIEKQKPKYKELAYSAILGVCLGVCITFAVLSWGGVDKILYIIIPGSLFVSWIINSKFEKDHEQNCKLYLKKLLIFYLSFIFSMIIINLFRKMPFQIIIQTMFLITTSVPMGFVLLFILVDYLIIYIGKERVLKKLKLDEKFRIFVSLVITLILGFIAFKILGQRITSLLSRIYFILIHPFGTERVGLTIAENAQPYIVDLIGQIGKTFFWLFFFGTIFLGLKFSKGLKNKKNQILLVIGWVVAVCAVLFSRISSNSILNGTNFISKLSYIIGLIIFIIIIVKIYFESELEISSQNVVISIWTFSMLIAIRSAVRFFFVLAPLIAFMNAFFIVELISYAKKSKGELERIVLWSCTILIIFLLIFSCYGSFKTISAQAKFVGPSANYQWQKAMEWVRNNTLENSIFIHWWDYGYWVQYLGERPTVTDGGHAVGYWDHLIGRYVLTTQNPETALSFMNAHNVSYFLIDQTDIGKYTAYSIIADDKENSDRYAWIPPMISQQKDIQETSTGMKRIYHGGFATDEDIIYEKNESQIFLPGQKTAILGIELEIDNINNTLALKQPSGIFFYNGKQYKIPIRYAYYANQKFDFKSGIESTTFIIPMIYNSNNGVQIDSLGALLYLSPRVTKGLFARLYLFNNYENIGGFKLVHSEEDPLIGSLKTQKANIGEFIYYQGVRGPIKIWEIEYPKNIILHEEFIKTSGEYGEFDDLNFTSY